jgi:hypothetical protein
MPLGADTSAAYEDFRLLRDKIDQYFALCQVARLAPLVAERVEPGTLKPECFEFANAEAIETFLAEAPLATTENSDVLRFDAPINPYYADALNRLRRDVLPRLIAFDSDALSLAQWSAAKQCFASHEAWVSAAPRVGVAELAIERLRTYRDEPFFLETLRELMQESHRRAFVVDNLRLVEKLILYQAYLMPFVNSFVSFPDLYDPQGRALFEMGTLVMDGRHFTLSVRVPDRASHAKLSARSNIFVLYVEVSGQGDCEPYEVAVPVTAGGRGKLHLDKRGIFKNLAGEERHARVIQVVENPISLSEAVVAPFRRLGLAVTSKLQEMTAKAEEKLAASGQAAMGQVTGILQSAPQKAVSTGVSGSTGGMLAGGGIAIAALGSSAAFITKTLAAMTWQAVFGGVLLAAAAVLVPTTLVAYLKLRQRDLSTILEGSGWAINARMWLNRGQAATFTFRPDYAPGVKGFGFMVRRWSWLVALVLLAIGAWFLDRTELASRIWTWIGL